MGAHVFGIVPAAPIVQAGVDSEPGSERPVEPKGGQDSQEKERQQPAAATWPGHWWGITRAKWSLGAEAHACGRGRRWLRL